MSDLSSMSAILSSEQGFDFDLMEICLHSWIHLMILMIFDIYNLHAIKRYALKVVVKKHNQINLVAWLVIVILVLRQTQIN